MDSKNTDFKTIRTEDLLQLLHTNKDRGLTANEAQQRLKKDGYNEVSEKKIHPIWMFLKKFWNLNAWLLEFIIFVSLLLHNYNDFYIVLALLLLNAILGFIQQYQASKSVEALKNRLQINARVLRDNVWTLIPSRELVSGDIVRVRSGDYIPADIKILKGNIWVNQATLTGESLEVEKPENEILYSGSIVTRAEATGVVILTGANTYFGRTIQLVQIAKPKLHIESAISNIIRSLLIVVVIMLTIGLAASLFKGIPLVKIIPLFLVLLLTVVPVALPTMFTITLALGSNKLVKKNVLITRLNALDDAASMDVICADKTGTITMNKFSITEIIPCSSFDQEDVLLYGALASEESNNDPIDMAFIDAAKRYKLLPTHFERKKFIPFDPDKRRTEVYLQEDQNEIQIMKGAFKIITSLCTISESESKKLEEIVNGFAEKGRKTIAVSIIKSEKTSLIGLAALQDIPYEDAMASIKELNNLGVSVKMLTGDALPIAREIASQVGLGTNIIRASDFKKIFEESPEKAIAIAEKVDGFAEIYPQDKYLIVKNLQAKGHIVGMTGDGVNDVPALKQAEVGTAIYNATDAAKGAASIVLTKEGLANISEPIKIGRMMFQTINTWILQKLVWTVLMTSLVVISLIFTGKFVLSSSAALFMLLLTDFGKVSLSTDHARWSLKPQTRKINDMAKVGIVLAFVILIESLLLLFLGSHYFGIFTNDQMLNTFTFEILFFFETFSIVIVRERGHFWDSRPSNFLAGALIFDTIAAITLSAIGLPGLKALPLSLTFFVLLFTLLCSLTINDFVKIYLLNYFKLSQNAYLNTITA